MYYTAQDVASMIGCNIRTAYVRIQLLNEELTQRGYWIERGKVPKAFFHEKYPYLKEQ